MVILSPSFTLLAAFCSLAGLALGPSFVYAAAVYSPGSHGFYVQSPFKVSRSAADEGAYIKRHCEDGRLLDVNALGLLDVEIGGIYHCPPKRRSSVIIPNQAGTSFYVAAASRYPNIAQRAHHKINGISTRDENGVPGRVDIMSNNDKSEEDRKIASFLAEPKPDGNFTLVASEASKTVIYLVDATKDSSDSPRIVNLQMHLEPKTDPYCVTYSVEDLSSSSSLTANPCTQKIQPNESRDFEYYSKTGVLRPFSKAADKKSSTSSDTNTAGTESVDLDDRDGTSIEIDNVTLMFVPDDQPANAQELAAVESPGVVTSTTTLTTTVTVTGSATPSAAAQDAAPTASSLTKPTGSASPSNEFQVKVEGPASSSGSGSSTPSSPEPTTSVNAEEVASRIAAGAQNTASPTSPTATPSLAAAALDETATKFGTQTPSAAPSGTPTPAALAAVDDNSTTSSSASGTSSAAGIPTSSVSNPSAPAGSPTPAALAALENSASSSSVTATPSETGTEPSGNNVSASSSATPTVTPLNVLMEAQA